MYYFMCVYFIESFFQFDEIFSMNKNSSFDERSLQCLWSMTILIRFLSTNDLKVKKKELPVEMMEVRIRGLS